MISRSHSKSSLKLLVRLVTTWSSHSMARVMLRNKVNHLKMQELHLPLQAILLDQVLQKAVRVPWEGVSLESLSLLTTSQMSRLKLYRSRLKLWKSKIKISNLKMKTELRILRAYLKRSRNSRTLKQIKMQCSTVNSSSSQIWTRLRTKWMGSEKISSRNNSQGLDWSSMKWWGKCTNLSKRSLLCQHKLT